MDSADLNKIERLMLDFKDEIKGEFRHQIGILSENFQHKLDIVVEGHQMLAEKMDRVKTELEQKIDCVARKVDAVAADLASHRADTESHGPIFRVKEPEK